MESLINNPKDLTRKTYSGSCRAPLRCVKENLKEILTASAKKS